MKNVYSFKWNNKCIQVYMQGLTVFYRPIGQTVRPFSKKLKEHIPKNILTINLNLWWCVINNDYNYIDFNTSFEPLRRLYEEWCVYMYMDAVQVFETHKAF